MGPESDGRYRGRGDDRQPRWQRRQAVRIAAALFDACQPLSQPGGPSHRWPQCRAARDKDVPRATATRVCRYAVGPPNS